VERSGAGMTCKAGDAHGLAAAVLQLVSLSDEERAEIGRNGLQVTRTEFDRGSLIRQLEDWFEKLRIGRPVRVTARGQ
jgi:colanic acid biosynthesis glycosyl transferase WcaI